MYGSYTFSENLDKIMQLFYFKNRFRFINSIEEIGMYSSSKKVWQKFLRNQHGSN